MSLKEAFERAKKGTRCKDCGASVPYHYIERHKNECISRFDVSKGDDSDIEVIECVLVTQNVVVSQKNKDEEISAQVKISPSCVKRPPPHEFKEVIDVPADVLYKKCMDKLELPVNEKSMHYTVRIFRHICKTVLTHSLTDEPCCSFWAFLLPFIYNYLSLEADERDVALWLCQNGRRWNVPSRLTIRNRENLDIVKIFPLLHKRGILTALSEEVEADLDDVLSILSSEEMKIFCSRMKLNRPRNKSEDSRRSIISQLENQRGICGGSIKEAALKNVRNIVGPIYRLNFTFYQFVISFCTVYSPFSMDSKRLFDDNGLVLIRDLFFEMYKIEGKTEKFMYCDKEIMRIKGVYRGPEDFIKFINTKLLEMECAKLNRKKKHEVICSRVKVAAAELQSFLMDPELLQFYKNVPDFLLKFTYPAILLRLLMHGIESAQKIKCYELACNIIAFILLRKDLDRFYMNRRGFLMDRLALNVEYHHKRPDSALKLCLNFMQDGRILQRYQLSLQDRAMKLAKGQKKEFDPVIDLREPEIIDIAATTLSKNLGNGRTNMFMSKHGDNLDYCSVEQIALIHLIEKAGFQNGLHREGGVWHTLFGLACFDIIFDKCIPNAWISELQTCPMDQNSAMFYESRQEDFENRFMEIRNDREKLCEIIKLNFEMYYGVKSAEIDWNTFSAAKNHDSLLWNILECVDLNMLVNLFRRFATDYRNSRSGMPDLTVWNKTEKKLAVVEVKGPGDKLSTKQRLWLDFFVRNGTRAVVCRVASQSSKVL